jgi:methionyl-tRNA formyltransferase
MKIVFMGTAELSCASLEKLARYFSIAAVVTQPDKPKGRELKLQFSPVKILAEKLKLAILQPARARDEKFISELRGLKPDLIVVVAYGQILPQSILDLPKFGCLNVHTSLLPKYRGASPIQSAILNGETETGVTIMKMDVGLDTGEIISQTRTPILPEDNSQMLHDRLAQLGADLLVETIPDYVAGKILPKPQPAEGASYAAKIKKEHGKINWNEPAEKILNRLRAFTPWPGVFTFWNGKLLKIWNAKFAWEIYNKETPLVSLGIKTGTILSVDQKTIIVVCGKDYLVISELQLEGGRRMSAQEFLAGHPLNALEKFPTH